MSRYQRGKTNLDFTEARDNEWQWHQLGHTQVCTSLQTDNHASTPPLSFLQAGCLSCHPTNSVKALKAYRLQTVQHISKNFFQQVVRQRLLLIDWRLSRTKQPLWCTHCDAPSQSSATTPRDKSAAVRVLPVFLNHTDLLVPSARECRLRRSTADTVI